MVICRNRGGAYIVAELDGTVWCNPVGAFHLIPYQARLSLPLPDLDNFLDISTDDLQMLATDDDPGVDEEGPLIDED